MEIAIKKSNLLLLTTLVIAVIMPNGGYDAIDLIVSLTLISMLWKYSGSGPDNPSTSTLAMFIGLLLISTLGVFFENNSWYVPSQGHAQNFPLLVMKSKLFLQVIIWLVGTIAAYFAIFRKRLGE